MKKFPEYFKDDIAALDRKRRFGYAISEFDLATTQEDIDKAAYYIDIVLSKNDEARYQKDKAKNLSEDVGEYVVNNVFKFRKTHAIDLAWKHVIREYLKNYVYNIRKRENVEGELRIALAKVMVWYKGLPEAE